MMDPSNPYRDYTQTITKIFQEGLSLPHGGMKKPDSIPIDFSSPKVLILAPHPDDECVMGSLPLRLRREVGSQVITLPITLGSNPDRKDERMGEIQAACEWIGFDLEVIEDRGLDNVNPCFRLENQEEWKFSTTKLADAIVKNNPDMLFFPNATDWNQTHLGVHLLVMDALSTLNSFSTILVETEFWGQMKDPNLMVESSSDEVADLVAALSHHRGEIKRNPFHLRLPAWMQDNVRRGAEVVGGQGGKAPKFDFATLYKLSRWEDGHQYRLWDHGKFLAHAMSGNKSILDQLK